MNEFIVWDKSDVKFWTLEELRETCELDILVNDDFSIKLINFGIEEIFNPDGGDYNQHFRREIDIETFNYIGLKDINGKKIYADSSIIKIEYLTKQWNKATGYFKYISSELGYCFQIGKTISIPIHKLIFKNIEIIDTIQENKLGLIK